jgi:hypothetical protein
MPMSLPGKRNFSCELLGTRFATLSEKEKQTAQNVIWQYSKDVWKYYLVIWSMSSQWLLSPWVSIQSVTIYWGNKVGNRRFILQCTSYWKMLYCSTSIKARHLKILLHNLWRLNQWTVYNTRTYKLSVVKLEWLYTCIKWQGRLRQCGCGTRMMENGSSDKLRINQYIIYTYISSHMTVASIQFIAIVFTSHYYLSTLKVICLSVCMYARTHTHSDHTYFVTSHICRCIY